MNWVRIEDTIKGERERKRLIRKPDQVGPGLPLLGSFCYGLSSHGCCFARAMVEIWPKYVLHLLAGVAGREDGPVPF